jgi:predicted acyl esterase
LLAKNSTGSLVVHGSLSNTKSTSACFNVNNSDEQFSLPSASVYITGIGKWINLTNYPPKEMNITPLQLNSRGQANSVNGNGFLEWNFNSVSSSSTPNSTSNLTAVSDSYTYDPANPRIVTSGEHASNSINTENR